VPGKPLAALRERGPVGLDREQIVRVLDGDQEVRGVAGGLQRIGGDDRSGQLQRGQQRPEPSNLAGGTVDLALGQHRTAGVVHRGQQVDLAAVTPGASQRLTVHRDGTSMSGGAVAVGQLRADHPGQSLGIQATQGAADGGLGRGRPVVGRVPAGAKRRPDRLQSIRGPLGDRAQPPGAGEHRSGGHGQDRDQRVAAPTGRSRVTDRGQVRQQVRRFGLLERLGVGELGQGGWDRG
jgi:hypothetical protein